MNKRSLCPVAALAALGTVVSGASAHAGQELRLGVQGVYSQWDVDVAAPVLSVADTISAGAPGLGVLAQYRFGADEAAERNYFVGLEVGLRTEGLGETQTFLVADVPATVETEASLSADVLWLAGYDFGKVTALVTTGITFLRNDIDASALGLRGQDANKHVGWRIGPGVEVDLTPSSSLIARANYTVYKEKSYTDQGLTLKVKPGGLDVGVAWMFKVDDLFGWLR